MLVYYKNHNGRNKYYSTKWNVVGKQNNTVLRMQLVCTYYTNVMNWL